MSNFIESAHLPNDCGHDWLYCQPVPHKKEQRMCMVDICKLCGKEKSHGHSFVVHRDAAKNGAWACIEFCRTCDKIRQHEHDWQCIARVKKGNARKVHELMPLDEDGWPKVILARDEPRVQVARRYYDIELKGYEDLCYCPRCSTESFTEVRRLVSDAIISLGLHITTYWLPDTNPVCQVEEPDWEW